MVSSVHIYSHALTKIFNDGVKPGNFFDIQKYSDITPVFEKGDMTDKSKSRPLSTISNFSNIFEKLIYTQINSFTESKLSKYQYVLAKTT